MKQAHTKTKPVCQTDSSGTPEALVNDHQKGTNGARGISSSAPHRRGIETQIKSNQTQPGGNRLGSLGSFPSTENDRLLTTEEIAPRLGFSVRKVREYSRRGKLPTVRLNKRDIRFHWPTVINRLAGV